MKLKEGIYEQVISNKIHEEIENRENEINIHKEEIEKEEAKVCITITLLAEKMVGQN